MDVNFTQGFQEYLDHYTKSFIAETVSNIVSKTTGIVGTCLTLSLTYSGLRTSSGDGEPFTDLFWKAVRWGTICSFATAGGFYQAYFVDIVMKAPDALANLFVAGGRTGSAANLIDQIASTGFTTSLTALHQMGLLSQEGLAMLCEGLLVGLVTIFMVIIGLIVITLSKFFLSILVCLGPLAIYCLLFASTTSIFNKWLGACLGSALTTVMFGVAFSFVAHFFTAAFKDVTTGAGNSTGLFGALAMSTIVTGLTYVIVKQIPAIATSIGDGIHVAAPQFANAAKSALDTYFQHKSANDLSQIASSGGGGEGAVPESIAHGSTGKRA